MFVSASTRCFADLDFWQALQQIHDLEYDKVEIWMDEDGALKPSVVLSDIDAFVAQFHEATRMSPVAFTLAQEISITEFASLCKLAKLLKVTQIVIPSSPLGTPFNSEIDRLKEMCKMAATEGIRVGIRTEKGHLSEDAHTAVELCQAIKGLGVSYDPSYFLTHPESTLELVAPHTFHVHLRDSTVQQVQVQVGLGEIDYSDIITQLSKENYRRALSVEILPDRLGTDHRALELRKIRMLLDSLL